VSLPLRSRPPQVSTRPRRALGALALGALFAGGALGVLELAGWLRSEEALPIRSIAVEGTGSERAHELRAFAEVRYGDPLLAVDLQRAARNVEQHPWVRSATARLSPPDGVTFEVVERKPLALLAGERLYLVDEDGTPFKRARAGDGLDLPVITGARRGAQGASDIDLALQVARAHAGAGAPGGALEEIHIEAPGRAQAVLADGLRVTLGGSSYSERFERLGRVLALLASRKEAASWVHLDDDRRPERVAVRLTPRPEMGATSGS
jgi:cell division septal protein FtsQ